MTTLGTPLVFAGHRSYAATVETGTVADPDFPAANLFLPRLSEVWKAPNGALKTQTIYVGLGGSRTDIDHVILHGVNCSDSATWKVRGATAMTAFSGGAGTIRGDTGTVSMFDTSLAQTLGSFTPPWGRTAMALYSATLGAVSYFEIKITDTANADGQIRASNLQIGPNYQLAKQFAPDWRQEDAKAGQPGLEKVIRKHRMTFANVALADATALQAAFRALKSFGRLYVIPQPLTPSAWLATVVLATVESYDVSAIPKLPDRRTLTATFAEVDD